jgi:uroporphyrinogen-III synthase
MTITEKFGTEKLPVIATFGDGTLRKAIESGIEVRANAPTPEAPSLAKAVDIFCTKIAKGEEVQPVQLKEDATKEEFIRTQQSKLAKKSRSRSSSSDKK